MAESFPLDDKVTTFRPDISILDEEGFNDGMSMDQVLNAVAGINNAKIGVQQVIEQGKEFIGITRAGTAEIFTDQARREQEETSDRETGK